MVVNILAMDLGDLPQEPVMVSRKKEQERGGGVAWNRISQAAGIPSRAGTWNQ